MPRPHRGAEARPEQTLWGGDSIWQDNDPSNPRLLLLDECLAMIKYAAARGLALPADALGVVDQARLRKKEDTEDAPDLATLAAAHAKLAAVVSPATPSTILVLADSSSSKYAWVRSFGATTYARWLFLLAVLTVIVFLIVLAQVEASEPSRNVQFLLTVAASLVGSVLYVLFNANRQVRAATIDKTQEGIYTAYLVLGVLSGTALAFLVIQPASQTTSNSNGVSAPIEVVLTRPLIALLGGFAVEAVYRVLQRLVITLEALVRGSEDELIQAQTQAAKARAAADLVNSRAALAARLVTIYAHLNDETLTDAARLEIKDAISELLPTTVNLTGAADKAAADKAAADKAAADKAAADKAAADKAAADKAAADKA